MSGNTAILLLKCPLKKGVAASLTQFVYRHHGDIVSHHHYVDPQNDLYFTRLEWTLDSFSLSKDKIKTYLKETLVDEKKAEIKLHFSYEKLKMAVFVSKRSGCLIDLLGRCHAGEWNLSIPLIVSNHPDLGSIAKGFGIHFFTYPVTQNNKEEQEKRQIALLKEYKIDFICLARYMQILTPQFVKLYPNNIINIHHSFLPAFPGARPDAAAYEYGVKMIGATSHYVTEGLDEGPIIDQDVVRVNHTHSVTDFIRLRDDLEKTVLARAVWAHFQNRILLDGRRTVVFS